MATRVGDDLPLVLDELGLHRLLQRHGLGGDDVHERAAWVPGKTSDDSFFSTSGFDLARMRRRAGRAASCGSWWW